MSTSRSDASRIGTSGIVPGHVHGTEDLADVYVLKSGDAMTGSLSLPNDDQYGRLISGSAQFTRSGPADQGGVLYAGSDAGAGLIVRRDLSSVFGGNADVNGVTTGKIWAGGHYGVQRNPVGSEPSGGPALLLDNTGGNGDTYLIGRPNGGAIRLRPTSTTIADYVFTTSGLSLPYDPSSTLHATRKSYVDAQDATLIPKTTQSITDWNSITQTGFYMASNAANAPAAGWWYGYTIVHNTSWMVQLLMPFANSYNENYWHSRTKYNGVWGSWYRVNNFTLSAGTQDNFTFYRHGGSYSAAGVSRWAVGNKKDTGTSAASDNDEFRVQWYNSAGTYVNKPIYIRSSDGKVRMPLNAGAIPTSGDVTTRTQQEPIEDDIVASVSVVVDLVADILELLGVVPAETLKTARTDGGLRSLIRQRLNIAHVDPDALAQGES